MYFDDDVLSFNNLAVKKSTCKISSYWISMALFCSFKYASFFRKKKMEMRHRVNSKQLTEKVPFSLATRTL